MYLLGSECTQENVDKSSAKIINKTYAAYKHREKTVKALGKHVINLYSSVISRVIKVKDVKELQQEIENDPIIKDQMVDLVCLIVCTFGVYLAPILVAVHTVTGDELENKGYESD